MDILNDDLIAFILSLADTKIIGICLRMNKRWKQIIETYSWMFNLNFSSLRIKNESLKYFKNIKLINLSYCHFITDNGFKYLKGVHTINLSCCKQITDKGISYLKGVHTINLNYCEKITDQGLEYLKGVNAINLLVVIK